MAELGASCAGKLFECLAQMGRSRVPLPNMRSTYFGRLIYGIIRPKVVQNREMLDHQEERLAQLKEGEDAINELINRVGVPDLNDLSQLSALCSEQEWVEARANFRKVRVNSDNPILQLEALLMDVYVRFVEVLGTRERNVSGQSSSSTEGSDGGTRLEKFVRICKGLFQSVLGPNGKARNKFDFVRELFNNDTARSVAEKVTFQGNRRNDLAGALRDAVKLFVLCYSWLQSLDPVDQVTSEYSIFNVLQQKLLPQFFIGEKKESISKLITWIFEWKATAGAHRNSTWITSCIQDLYVETLPDPELAPSQKGLHVYPDDVASIYAFNGNDLEETNNFLPHEDQYSCKSVIAGRIRVGMETGTRCVFACTIEWVPLLPSVHGIGNIAFHEDHAMDDIEVQICTFQLSDQVVRMWVTGGRRPGCIAVLDYDVEEGTIESCEEPGIEHKFVNMFVLNPDVVGVTKWNNALSLWYPDYDNHEWNRKQEMAGGSARNTTGFLHDESATYASINYNKIKLLRNGVITENTPPFKSVALVQGHYSLIAIDENGHVQLYQQDDGTAHWTVIGRLPADRIRSCRAVIAGPEAELCAILLCERQVAGSWQLSWEMHIAPLDVHQ